MDTPQTISSARPGPVNYRTPLLCLLLAIAAFVVFLPALQNDFVYDDFVDVRQVDNVFIPGAWPKLFYTASAQLYRPVKYISYYVDNAIWGWKPFGWHLQSLLWHCLNSILAYFLLRKFRVTDLAAGLGALWFAVHPIHAEAVVWISSRASLISTTGVFACAIAYMNWRETGRRSYLAWLAVGGFIGIFGKEDALMIFPLLLAYELWFRAGGKISGLFQRSIVLSLALLGGIAFIYLLLRQSILTGLKQGEWEAGFSGVIATLPVILVTYLGQLTYPTSMAVDQPVDYAAGLGWPFIACTLLLLALIAPLAVPGARFARWKFIIAWFLISLLPVMGLIPINQPRADRFLYLPSFAGALLIAYALDELQSRKPSLRPIAVTAVALLAVCFGASAYVYSQVWKDEQTLWEHTLKANPKSFRAYANLAAAANNHGNPKLGLQLIDQALAIKPAYPEGFVIKAYALDAQGRAAEAEDWYRKALANDPNNTLWLFLLGTLFERTGRLEEAAKTYDRVVELRPSYVQAQLNAGVLAVKMNHPEKAVAHWEAALKYDPNNEAAKYNLQIIMKKTAPK